MVATVVKTVAQAKKVLSNYTKARAQMSGPKMSSSVKRGITTLINNREKIVKGEKKTADVVKNFKTRRQAFKKLTRNKPLRPIYDFLGGKNLQKQQQSLASRAGMRPTIAKKKKELNKKVKEYFKKQIKSVKSGRGDIVNLLANRASKKLGMAPGTYDIRKSQFSLQVPKSLKRYVEYTKGFVATPAYERLGKPKMTLSKVKNLMAQSEDIRRNVRNSYERVLKFLDRSARFNGSPVISLNNAKKLRDRKFQLGDKVLSYKYIRDNFETDPLFEPMKNVERYKAKVYTAQFKNPKTGKIQPLNEIAFDLLGRKASDIFHIHHTRSVATNPLDELQIVFGPVNRYAYNLQRRLEGGKINNDEFTSLAKKYNFGTNDFSFQPTPPMEFANEAYKNVLNMYNNNISLKKVLGLKKGGIACLKN